MIDGVVVVVVVVVPALVEPNIGLMVALAYVRRYSAWSCRSDYDDGGVVPGLKKHHHRQVLMLFQMQYDCPEHLPSLPKALMLVRLASRTMFHLLHRVLPPPVRILVRVPWTLAGTATVDANLSSWEKREDLLPHGVTFLDLNFVTRVAME